MPHRPLRLLVATLAVAGLALAGCGNDDDEAATNGGDDATTTAPAAGEDTIDTPPTIEEGTLSVCSDVPYEPFEMEGDGPSGYTGFDIDVLNAVATKAGLEVSVSDVDFDGILGNLEADSCDVVASAVTIDDERAQQVDFTEPYFDADQSLLVKIDGDVASLDDLAGASIGVQSGTTGEAYANENTPEGAEVKSFDGADSLFAALESGDVDAILQDYPVNAYRVTQDDSLEVVEQYQTNEEYGFAVKKGNAELLAALNEGLATIRENGEYDSIYETYIGTAPGE